MDVMTAITTRRSVRSYSTRPIPPEVIERMKLALRNAPSACNLQPWHFIFITDETLRTQAAKLSHDQIWMADAPVIVAALGFSEEAYKQVGGKHNSVEIDVATALDHLMLAAAAEGLGTCWIGAFKEDEARKLLCVPEHARVIALMPLGYPTDPNLLCPIRPDQRKSDRELFSTNRYEGT